MTSVGAAKVSNRFQAAVIIAKEQDDLELMLDMLVRFETCPVVVFVGNIALPPEFSNSRIFSVGKVGEGATLIHKKIKEV